MAPSSPLPALKHIHHMAFRCRDAEETRHFYEDILGLPLAAAMQFDEVADTGTALTYMHLFFQMGDDNFVAFFDAPNSATEKHFKKRSGFNVHIAIETEDMAGMELYRQRLVAHGIECIGPLDHHFVKSIYFYDPNGLNVEITVRAPDYDQIMTEEKRKSAEEMRAWTGRMRALKQERGLQIPAQAAAVLTSNA